MDGKVIKQESSFGYHKCKFDKLWKRGKGRVARANSRMFEKNRNKDPHLRNDH